MKPPVELSRPVSRDKYGTEWFSEHVLGETRENVNPATTHMVHVDART